MRIVVPILLAGFFSVMALAMLGMDTYWSVYEKVPEQPIAYPHDIHAGDQQIPCEHCHKYTGVSKFATVPAMDICMDCHLDMQTDSPEIAKLKKYWADKTPIPWQRVHSVPDHVYFSHKRHIKAGVDCASCHGDLKVVKTVKKVRTLQMGFCVECHRANGAPTDCWTCHK